MQDIDSRFRIFFQTRNNLAILYTILSSFIVILFSIIYYISLDNGVASNINSSPSLSIGEKYILLNHTDQELKTVFGLADIGFIIFLSILSYYLAGKNLEPIIKAHNAQKQFINDASHELKTPLAIMKTNLEINLQETQTKQAYQEVLRDNLEEVDRMTKIVEDLLSLSKYEEQPLNEDLTDIELNRIIRSSINKINNYAYSKDIKIEFKKCQQDIIVNADKYKLQQVLMNILKNAVDYSDSNTNVKVKLESDNKDAIISIIDQGVGIPEEDLPHVFERFYRVDKSRSRKIGGNGIGLSIVKSIVEGYHGRVTVESNIKKGTIFRVFLPLKK